MVHVEFVGLLRDGKDLADDENVSLSPRGLRRTESLTMDEDRL